MIEIKFKPIVQWPGKESRSRRASQFSANYSDTIQLLLRELEHLNARNPVIIQTYHSERDIRLDGLPRADARVPPRPGVIVTIERRVGWNARIQQYEYEPLSFPCDTFTKWQDNLRAIALALEALRKVDRYGVTQNGQQYRGWKALPPASESDSVLTAEDAARFVASITKIEAAHILGNPSVFRLAYKNAAMKLHPDQGGDHSQFVKLQEAAALLNKKHGLDGSAHREAT